MRLIGMLGGMSPESTQLYYRFLHESVQAATGDPAASAQMLLFSVDFSALSKLQRLGDWDAATKMLTEATKRLVAAGAEIVFISANTMHICAQQVAATLPPTAKFVHIGDVIVKAAGPGSKLLLLGTKYTMELPFLRDHVTAQGVVVQVPAEETRQWLQNVIYQELTRGIVNVETQAQFARLLGGAAKEGYDAVVLGCTELGMLVEGDNSPIRLIDTAKAHASAVVELALAG